MTHLAIVGPTACGKSTIALEVARHLAGPPIELVSVDSMQVYRGMDIGTAKPTKPEQAEIPHHLIDLVEPTEEFGVAQFQAAARDAITGIEARGHRALLVGGTGLYVRAIVDRLSVPGRWPNVVADLDTHATGDLYARLQRLDPLAASRMEPGNRRRVLRALEVTIGSGAPFSSYGDGLGAYPPTDFTLIGIWLPRTEGAARIRRRFDAMLEAGWLDEVAALHARDGVPLSKTAAQALGYKELFAHLDGELTLDDARVIATTRTIAFARRQRVWFRRDPRVTWFGAPDDPLRVLPTLMSWIANS